MRIGILGGTFDPPHVGHLIAAQDAAEALGLDRVLFVPAATQPLKAGREMAPAADRVEMVRLMLGNDPRFSVETAEVERGGLSYTVDTLRALRRRWPAGSAELVLLLGADAAAQFPQWKEPSAVRELAEVVVLTRGDESEPVPSGLRAVPTRRVDVSSTEVRDRVRAGKPVRGLVTDPVAAYIAARGLYR
jgi:nicotinate-nucleotide adenylyltransferase